MAIVIEERRESNIGSIITWLLVLIVIGIAGYYIFFKNPGMIEVKPSNDFVGTAEISKISLKPDEIIGKLSGLTKRTLSPVKETGRANPFLPL